MDTNYYNMTQYNLFFLQNLYNVYIYLYSEFGCHKSSK